MLRKTWPIRWSLSACRWKPWDAAENLICFSRLNFSSYSSVSHLFFLPSLPPSFFDILSCCSLLIIFVAMVTVTLSINLIYHPFIHPTFPSSVVSVESVVSSSSHPGGARAPSGGPDRQHSARPGPAPTSRHHDNTIINHTWTYVDNTNATTIITTHAQSASVCI